MKSDFKPPSIFDDGETIMPRKKPVAFAESEAADHTEAQMRENRKYIVLDAALWDTDIDSVFEFGNKHCCLFATKAAEHELDYVAPYLFCVSDNTDFEEWVNAREQKYPIERRTVRLTSSLDLDGLRKHLRRFLRVKKENSSFLYYRFYDPKVLACTFPNLTEEQSNGFFSGVNEVVHFSDVLRQKRIYTYSNGKCAVKIESEFIM